MRGLTLLLTASLSVTLSAAWAQHQQEATYFLRHSGARPAYARPPSLAGLPAAAPLPTVWAAAIRAPLPIAGRPSQLWLRDSLPQAPRLDATGVQPLYNLYGRLPEDFRKHTLPAVYTEPLPVQLLRGLLGQ